MHHLTRNTKYISCSGDSVNKCSFKGAEGIQSEWQLQADSTAHQCWMSHHVFEWNAELFWWKHPLPVYVCRLHCWLRNVGIKHAALTDSCTAVAFLTCQTRTPGVLEALKTTQESASTSGQVVTTWLILFVSSGGGARWDTPAVWICSFLKVKNSLNQHVW